MYSQLLGYSKLNVNSKASKQFVAITAYDANAFKSYPSTLKSGTLPTNSSQIAISENLNDKTGSTYKIGDTITLDVGTKSDDESKTLSNITKKTYTITGILDPSYTEKSYSDSFTALTFLDVSKLSGSETTTVGVIFKDLSAMDSSVKEMSTSANAPKYDYNNSLLAWSGHSSYTNVNTFLYTIAAVVIFLIIVGSVAVIYNAFAISVNERKKQFGILASIGATSKQIKRMVYKESTIMGAIGIPLGLIIGYLGMFITFSFINSFYIFGMNVNMQNANFNVIISPAILALTLAILVVTIFVSALVPARKAARVTPLEAIMLTNDIKISSKKLKTSKLTQKLFGIEGVIALKNLKRNRKRYRTTIFSLFISIVLFISFSTMIYYAFDLTDQELGKVDYDFSISVSNVNDTDQFSILNKANKLGGSGDYWIYRSLYAYADSGTTSEYQSTGNTFSQSNGSGSVNLCVIEMQDDKFSEYAKEVGIDPTAFSESDVSGILINK